MIEVEGQDIMALGEKDLIELRRSKMGMVFQSFNLFPHKTVLENITLAPGLRRRFVRELLGHHGKVPEIVLYEDAARINRLKYRIEDPHDLEGLRHLREFLQSPDDIHMFLTSHFCYPPGTRIITFSRKKPLIIMYKEIDPLRLRVV